MKAFLVEVGILLGKDNPEFDAYATAYDKEHGYYDEGQYYVESKEKALEDAKKYVNDGVENTYAVVSNTELPDDFDFDFENDSNYVEDETYDVDSVIFSAMKQNGVIVESFIKKSAYSVIS